MNTTTLSYIGNQWTHGQAAPFPVVCPYTGVPITQVAGNTAAEVDRAVNTASRCVESWSSTPLETRKQLLLRYAELVRQHETDIARSISLEVGKPAWEAATEVKTMAGKVQLSINAYHQRCADFGSGEARTRFRPHGVMAVLGPFNFPCHLPNGHIVPALLAGNTVVLKASEKTPASSAWIVRLLLQAGLPEGVIQLIQGLRETGEALVNHPLIDGLAFTGSVETGEYLGKVFAQNPGKIIALELGGNNPLVAWDTHDPEAAAITILQSAFITAGQRCTCARRLILPTGRDSETLLELLSEKTAGIRVDVPDAEPAAFCGPVISTQSADALLAAQQSLLQKGATAWSLLERLRPHTGLLQPGILEVTNISDRQDREYFGPLLQVIRVPTFEQAIAEANHTRFGLAAGLLSDNEALYQQFYRQSRAGLINWNYPLPGASGAAPFGGIGRSGNFRPSGFFAADYCAYPVASMESPTLCFPEKPLPGLW